MDYNHRQNYDEISDAIDLGYQILDSLERAERTLGIARGLGIWDMMGGKFLSNVLKHSQINKANDELAYTRTLLDKLRREIGDIHFTSDVNVEIGGFAVFADFFFDNLIADWYVQSKINENRRKVQDVKYQIQTVIGKLTDLKAYEQSFL